eukprot:TRINITY_DN27305_c0_g1_i1.p1 TRINITY_DN27305_c0_g1~~TRINITY_DN27305_c0_g1_i1.p1  ORF type:complete len:110 (+),score=7.84 TRINITY_DN27305_c0_g1_i1:413-742(+)
MRIELAKGEMPRALADEDLINAPVLIFANKHDLGCMSVAEVAARMGMHELRGIVLFKEIALFRVRDCMRDLTGSLGRQATFFRLFIGVQDFGSVYDVFESISDVSNIID